MEGRTVRFNREDRPEFVKELRFRVNQYFKEKGISTNANAEMVFKTVFMLFLYLGPLSLFYFGVVETFWQNVLIWVAMAFGMAGIGLAVMHDANHGAYSKNRNVNKVLGYMLNLIGGYHINWKIQHNVLHHSFTNVAGHDEDIERSGIMRFSPHQPWKPVFKYQIIYAPFLYGFMTLYWIMSKDFEQVIDYEKRGLLKPQGISLKKALLETAITKIFYFSLLVGLPIALSGLPWGYFVGGIVIMHFVAGLILALIFQPAHVQEDTQFVNPGKDGSIQNNWSIHQLHTTANFANKNWLLTWFCGGLNYQIEHHLFPNICHVHYPSISKIVKKTAHEYGVPYHEHKTFTSAVASHFRLLNDLGTGEYDRRIEREQKEKVKEKEAELVA